MHDWARCRDEAANHQLPIAAALWIIQILSIEECSSVTQNLMQICCSTSSVILNVTTTQYTRSLNGVYCPHWLVQWSRHCSCMCIPVHSPWLSGYMDIVQTVVIILTMAGLFPRQTLYNKHSILEMTLNIPHVASDKLCNKLYYPISAHWNTTQHYYQWSPLLPGKLNVVLKTMQITAVTTVAISTSMQSFLQSFVTASLLNSVHLFSSRYNLDTIKFTGPKCTGLSFQKVLSCLFSVSPYPGGNHFSVLFCFVFLPYT